MALVADGMNSVNAVILDRMQSRIPLIPALAGHLVAGGGKQAHARCSRSRGPR
jgi:octaprenyl-diphosphate synthase